MSSVKGICAYAALILLLMAIFPKIGFLIMGTGLIMAVMLVLVLVVIGAVLFEVFTILAD